MSRPDVVSASNRNPAAVQTTNASLSAVTRRRITDVACALVVREGFANLTLESVARAAEVSKGGLLYHFPSKRALLEGMVEERCRGFEEQMQKFLALEKGPGRVLRAVIRASCSHRPTHLQESAALFAVLANDNELLAMVREKRSRCLQQIKGDDIDPIDAAIVTLAIDGMCFNELLGMAGPRGAQRDQVIQRLLAMTTTPATPSKP